MENVDMFNNATAQLTFHDFLDRMRHPSAADLVRSIKKWVISNKISRHVVPLNLSVFPIGMPWCEPTQHPDVGHWNNLHNTELNCMTLSVSNPPERIMLQMGKEFMRLHNFTKLFIRRCYYFQGTTLFERSLPLSLSLNSWRISASLFFVPSLYFMTVSRLRYRVRSVESLKYGWKLTALVRLRGRPGL